jgi:hypothetical protein
LAMSTMWEQFSSTMSRLLTPLQAEK